MLAVGIAALTLVSPAWAHRGRVFGVSFGTPGSGAGQLSLGVTIGGSGLAVDEASRDVYVADTGNQRVDEFKSDGTFVRAWGWGVRNGASEFQICTEATGCRAGLPGAGAGQFENPIFVAVDNTSAGEGDVYVANFDGEGGSPGGEARVQKFTPEGVLVGTWGTEGRIGRGSVPSPEILFNVGGIAVTPPGNLLVTSNGGDFEFSQSTGAFVARIGESEASAIYADGVAVDGAGDFYIAAGADGRIVGGELKGQLIEKFNSEGFSHGLYQPGSADTQMVFELQSEEAHRVTKGLAAAKSGELFVDEGDAIQVVASSCVEQCAPIATFTSPELTDGSGLAVDSQHEVLYIAEVARDEIESIVPEPPAVPLVSGESVLNVSADSATLEATINPRSEASEEPTSYRFQYTTEERFEREGFAGSSVVPVPGGQLAPSFEASAVAARIQGLEAGTVYRYRVVADNAISRKEGKAAEGERNQAGEEIARTFTTQSLSGLSLLDGRVWELVSPPNKDGALLGFGDSPVQAAAGGDAVTYMATAPTESGASGNTTYTQVLSTRGGVGASSWVSRDISPPHELANGWKGGSAGEYRFFSGDLSVGIINPFGQLDSSLSSEASEQTAFLHADFPVGDPGDLCAVSCFRPLVTGAPGFANVPEGEEFGREISGAPCPAGTYCGPQFAGSTPDGSHIIVNSAKGALTEGAPAVDGLYEWFDGRLSLVSVLPNGSPSDGTLGEAVSTESGRGIGRKAVSDDGSRVVWTANQGSSLVLYLRDMVSEETVKLGVKLGRNEAMFQTASSDGSRVFYTIAGDLYEFEAPVGEPLSAGHVTNLVPSGVLGFLPGVSRDGSYVYFVATSALTGEPNEHGEAAIAGQPNLYVEHEGTVRLVAVLSNGDEVDWMREAGNIASGGIQLSSLTSRVTSNGRWLAFMSERSLTGYDNRDARSGERDQEAFLYNADENEGRGRLVCASCDPTGARPDGIFTGGVLRSLLVNHEGAWESQWLAANVPGWVSSGYQSRYLSDSGRLFFDSPDALVPADTNGTEDVYEYEPAGVGSCTTGAVTYGPDAGGCVDLVSSGVSKEESVFIDASETGDDVFFFTSAQLEKSDLDDVLDVYDARVDGGFAVPQPPPACEGDACQSPAVAPNDPTPGSLTYSGPANPTPLLAAAHAKTKKKPIKCAKHRKLSHGKCVIKQTRSGRAKRANGHKGRRGHGRSTGRTGRTGR